MPSVSGWVQTREGAKVGGASVRLRNVGGTVTTASGEFTIPLRQDFGPGGEVVFDVAGWVVVSPYDGRAFVPRQGSVGLVVARKGDAAILDKEYIARLRRQGTSRARSDRT